MILDINTCTSRQLTSLPGIDRRLADAITRQRHEKGRFLHMDDLWRVSGMDRPRFQLLQRHFKVNFEQKKSVTPKITVARLPLTSSMVDFVCKGQSVTNDQLKSNPLFRPTLNIPHSELLSGATRNGKRYRLPSDTESKSKINHKLPHSHEYISSRSKSVPSHEKPTSATTTAKRTKTDTPPCARCITSKPGAESSRTKALTGDDGGTAGHGGGASSKPTSFTLKTSPSGNNINFTCTIDKRLLGQHSASLAFQFDQGMSGVKEKSAGPRKLGAGLAKVETKDAGHDADDSSNGDFVTAVQAVHAAAAAHPTAPLQHFVNQAELPSIAGSKPGTSSSSLTEENILLYERKNTPNPTEKIKTIEAWVDDVNDARNVGKLLKGRSRESPARNFQVKLLQEEKARQKMTRPELTRYKEIERKKAAALSKDKDCNRCRDQTKVVQPIKPKPLLEKPPTPPKEAKPEGRRPRPGQSRRDGAKQVKEPVGVPANTPRDKKATPEHPPVDAKDVSDALKHAKQESQKSPNVDGSKSTSTVCSLPKKVTLSQAERMEYLRHQRRVVERNPRKHGRNRHHAMVKRFLAPAEKQHRSESDVQAGKEATTSGGGGGKVEKPTEEPQKKLTHPSRKYYHGRKRHGYDYYGRRHERYSRREEEACRVM